MFPWQLYGCHSNKHERNKSKENQSKAHPTWPLFFFLFLFLILCRFQIVIDKALEKRYCSFVLKPCRCIHLLKLKKKKRLIKHVFEAQQVPTNIRMSENGLLDPRFCVHIYNKTNTFYYFNVIVCKLSYVKLQLLARWMMIQCHFPKRGQHE